jgi:hypothetical protein
MGIKKSDPGADLRGPVRRTPAQGDPRADFSDDFPDRDADLLKSPDTASPGGIVEHHRLRF